MDIEKSGRKEHQCVRDVGLAETLKDQLVSAENKRMGARQSGNVRKQWTVGDYLEEEMRKVRALEEETRQTGVGDDRRRSGRTSEERKTEKGVN